MLNRFFDMENPLMRALGAICDLLVLNLLTVLCSLPILTCGAALSALFDVTLRIIRREEPRIVHGYFKAMRSNFRKGSLLGLVFLALSLVLAVDSLAASLYAPPLRIAAAAGAMVGGAVAIYAFALQARYENTVPQTLKNALSLSIVFFPRTLGMLVFCLGLWLTCLTFYQYALPVLLMFGLSLPAYVCSLLLDGVFRRMENDEENDAAGKNENTGA